MNNNNLDEMIRLELNTFRNRIRAVVSEAVELDVPLMYEVTPPFQPIINTYNRLTNAINELNKIDFREVKPSQSQDGPKDILNNLLVCREKIIPNDEGLQRITSLNDACRNYSKMLNVNLNYTIAISPNNNWGHGFQSALPERVRIANRINTINALSEIAQSEITEENVVQLSEGITKVLDTHMYTAREPVPRHVREANASLSRRIRYGQK